ncbi:TetR/AcrR family transcriptional regulator [Solicola gregarius]|uniref:TetR/AcrR family transcriptional regulator n=1 Tax=Solicola gregarius TaxID=2908642 RepID=A0AA46TM12_9ACTN|nr:TetR/AcrR family transcriptional regulator [Solicola gregarius]UYM07794.1 TetR/AcrR family transcriptional regulator [Solicola gregarius]
MGGEPATAQRPKRADARRNYDALLDAAREAFRTRGTDATLEEIARGAGVGIGTLYRHFPTRLALAEVVYREDVEALATAAKEAVAEMPPWDALASWTDKWMGVVASKRVIFAELADAVGKNSELVSYCRDTMRSSADLVLTNAQRAGVARDDIDAADLLRLVGSIVHVPNPEPGQIRRLGAVMLDGVRV